MRQDDYITEKNKNGLHVKIITRNYKREIIPTVIFISFVLLSSKKNVWDLIIVADVIRRVYTAK